MARQQIDTTLSLTQLCPTPEAYKEHIVMLDEDVLSIRNLTNILYLLAWRLTSGYICPILIIVLLLKFLN